jgi:hemerythrin-like domain-containing protein
MLIYEALKKDHDKLKVLLNDLVGAADASEETRNNLIQQIRDELIPHARAEEAVFYNPLKEIDGTQSIVMHGYAEHMEAETILRTLQAMNAVNVEWTALAKKLKDGIEHHIAEEENEIFAAAQQVLAVEEAELMADAFEKLKPEIRKGGFMQNTLDLIANLMPERLAAPIRSFNLKV